MGGPPLADPDLPPGVVVPVLPTDPPAIYYDARRYARLRVAFDSLPRRVRVVLVLRSKEPPVTQVSLGALFGFTNSRAASLEALGAAKAMQAWRGRTPRFRHPNRGLPGTRNPHDDRYVFLFPLLQLAVPGYSLPPDLAPAARPRRAPRPFPLNASPRAQ